MEKFLSIPVTGETNFLLSVSDVISIRVGDATGAGSNPTTNTTIIYMSGNTADITHATVGSTNEMRDSLQNAMVEAQEKPWTDVVFAYVPPKAVSAIAIA
tara:strand:- start:1599 stop:1898 length:300 start_codon:yes stop_codon:yes gene_type:complete